MEIMNLIKTGFSLFGMIIFLSCILPPIHLIFDKDRENKEKELNNMINFENMTRKQQLNLFGKIFLGAVLMAIPFLKF